MGAEACLSCPKDPTCTSPCYVCGICVKTCCQNLLGRTGLDRLIFFCLSGREDDQKSKEMLDDDFAVTLEKESFVFCDENQDHGLSWPEVSNCLDKFGHFVKDVDFPTSGDFN